MFLEYLDTHTLKKNLFFRFLPKPIIDSNIKSPKNIIFCYLNFRTMLISPVFFLTIHQFLILISNRA